MLAWRGSAGKSPAKARREWQALKSGKSATTNNDSSAPGQRRKGSRKARTFGKRGGRKMFQVRLLHISFYQVPSYVCGTGRWAAHWSSFQSFRAEGRNRSGEGTYNQFQFSFPKEVGTDCDWQRLTKFQTFTTPAWTANLTASPRPEAVFSLPVKGIFRGILRGLSYLGKYSKGKEGIGSILLGAGL